MFRKFLLPLLVPCAFLAFSVAPAGAETLGGVGPWFHVTSASHPSYLPPTKEEGGKSFPGKA